MKKSTMNALLRGALCAGLASCPLCAADLASPDSGAGGFWALVFGMMLTMFGGMALCYGLVKLAEKIVRRIRTSSLVPISAPHVRHAA